MIDDLVDKGRFVYIDDVIVLGQTETQHFQNIKSVLETLGFKVGRSWVEKPLGSVGTW